jgi:hypothetical protein
MLENLPSLPDLAPVASRVPQNEESSKGTRFQSVDDVKSKKMDLLNRLSAEDLFSTALNNGRFVRSGV